VWADVLSLIVARQDKLRRLEADPGAARAHGPGMPHDDQT
jgi:hypothetical protein